MDQFAHRNGSYNWVTLGAKGKLIEMEMDLRWDYFHGHRQNGNVGQRRFGIS